LINNVVNEFDVDESTARLWQKKKEELHKAYLNITAETIALNSPTSGTATGAVGSIEVGQTEIGGTAFLIRLDPITIDIPGLTNKDVQTVAPTPTNAGERKELQPSTRPAPTFRSVGELLAKLPKELQPVRGQWDKFTLVKVQDWLGQNILGSNVEGTIYIDNISVDPNAGAEPGHRWRVSVSGLMEMKPATIGGCVVGGPADGYLREHFDVDDATAKQWQNKKDAMMRRVQVGAQSNPKIVGGTATGAISSVNIDWRGNKEYRMQLVLEGMAIDIPGLTPKPPPAAPVR